MFDVFEVYVDGDVGGMVEDLVVFLDFDLDCVEIDYWIEFF